MQGKWDKKVQMESLEYSRVDVANGVVKYVVPYVMERPQRNAAEQEQKNTQSSKQDSVSDSTVLE